MREPLLFGVPLTLMFLYFVWYALLGWGMESIYCSVKEKRWINRGFLHLPLCPIYGVGALIMVTFFTPLIGNPFLFYLVATLVLSAWEYFVGWLLEVTTHMKYWDYSDRKFNLKGRICLTNCIWWGIIAYIAIFWIHPATVTLMGRIPVTARQIVAAVLAVLVLADTAMTIRQLALLRKALIRAEEARVQFELGRRQFQATLADRRAEMQQTLAEKKEALQSNLEERADQARLRAELAKQELLEKKLVQELMDRSRRFRAHYSLTSRKYPQLLAEMRRRSAERIEALAEKMHRPK